ncbi:MAG: translation initiation factor IF-2 [Zetaproteobacteria bacterium]|nr:translation initiation factor IF-2 [Pseudobdellovibrionaceae bacterium]
MSKIRVYELAREMNVESKVLVGRLKDMGIVVASHQSTLTGDQILQAKKAMKGGASPDKASANPRVIRRRRKAEAAPPEAEVSSSDADSGMPMVSDNETGPEEQVQQGNEASEDESSLVEVADSDSSTNEVEAAESSTAEPVVAETATTESKVAETTLGEPALPSEGNGAIEEQASAEVVRKPGGATIVRRATPEEVEARKVAIAARAKQGRQGKHNRTGDSPARPDAQPSQRRSTPKERGPDRPKESRDKFAKAPPAPSDVNDIPNPLDEAGGRNRGRRSGGEAWRDEKAVAVPGQPVQKRPEVKKRRDKTDTRTILNLADRGEEVRVGKARKRTVYTPSASGRRRDLKRRKDLKKTQLTVPRAAYRVVKMGEEITVGDFSQQLNVKSGEIIKKLMGMGVMATINQSIDLDTATLIASEYNFEIKNNVVTVDDVLTRIGGEARSEGKVERPPIVTIMGHVDHGKTSILDAIRNSGVAATEAGGITQHIGAYTVEKDGKTIAFLDTPGHEAFSAMRARGAKATDIVILVVAADDGVMPQTVEAISHAKEAGVPIIVAVNKIDKPNINIDRVNTELMEHAIQSEEWGGEHQFVKVSAIKGTGIEELLDAINLQAEILELTADFDRSGEGVVIEAHLDKGRGPVTTVLVRDGVVKVGDTVVAGVQLGRVRAMLDHQGKSLENAGPSIPVQVLGLSGVPETSDIVNVVADEKIAREISDIRKKSILDSKSSKSSAASLEELLDRVNQGSVLEVPVIIKADTQGSLEATAEAIMKIASDKVKNRIVHKAVGGVTESDVTLAEAANAVIIAFNVRCGRGLDRVAETAGVLVEVHSVIYDIVESMKAMMAGRLPPIQTEVVQGHAEVRQTIKVPKVGIVAGTSVLDGKITRNAHLRLIREDIVIFTGKIGSLRRFKDDVKEVAFGYECGIGFDGYSDIKEGDILEAFIIEESAATL